MFSPVTRKTPKGAKVRSLPLVHIQIYVIFFKYTVKFVWYVKNVIRIFLNELL